MMSARKLLVLILVFVLANGHTAVAGPILDSAMRKAVTTQAEQETRTSYGQVAGGFAMAVGGAWLATQRFKQLEEENKEMEGLEILTHIGIIAVGLIVMHNGVDKPVRNPSRTFSIAPTRKGARLQASFGF